MEITKPASTPVPLPDSRARRMKIVVGTNSLTESQYPAYSNHVQFWFRLGRSYPNIEFLICNPSRMSIDRMRNLAARVALETEADYLLFLDDDVLVPPATALAQLLECNADIAAGKVCIRGYPFQYMIFRGKPEDPKGLYALDELPESGIEDCDAVGFSFCLIKTEVLRSMPPPHFVTGMNNTEDIYFCVKAKLANPNLSIKVNCSLDCAHILWPEVISSENREAYTEYFKKINLHCDVKEQKLGDRGSEYLEMVKKQAAEGVAGSLAPCENPDCPIGCPESHCVDFGEEL